MNETEKFIVEEDIDSTESITVNAENSNNYVIVEENSDKNIFV